MHVTFLEADEKTTSVKQIFSTIFFSDPYIIRSVFVSYTALLLQLGFGKQTNSSHNFPFLWTASTIAATPHASSFTNRFAFYRC